MTKLLQKLSSLMVSMTLVATLLPHTMAQNFDFFIVDAQWDPLSEMIGVEWVSNVPAEEFTMTVDSYFLPNEDFEISLDMGTYSGNTTFAGFGAEPNRRVDIFMNAYDANGNLLSDDVITVYTDTFNSKPDPNAPTEGFGIIAADYDEFNGLIGVFWDTYQHPAANSQPIDYFLLSYNVHDNFGNFEFSVEEIIIEGTSESEYYFPAEPNKEYFIFMEGVTADGIIAGGDDITVSTAFGQPFLEPFPEPFYPPLPPEIYFINEAYYDFDAEQVIVRWDPFFSSDITEFEFYYDIYDIFTGEYVLGSQVYRLPAGTGEFTIEEAEDGYEVLVTVNALSNYGLVASDFLSVYTDAPEFFPPGGANPFLDLDIAHSYGPQYVVDLFVGEEIDFFASHGTINTLTWQQLPEQILDCSSPASDPALSNCIAMRPGQTEVFFEVTTTDGAIAGSPGIIVYVNGDFHSPVGTCPVYPPPNCPNGAYYPPTADGCPGPPICKDSTGSATQPLYGYEDPVITRFPEESNPFTDTDVNTLEGKAAAQLFYMDVIGGRRSGQFDGKALVNRAEAAKFLLLAKATAIIQSFTEADNQFWDVIVSEWYGPFVLMAAQLGVIEGHPDKSFKPADPVITAELLAMLARCFKLELNLPHSYKDEAKYKGAWFWEYAGIAKKYDLFPNRKEFLNPEKPLTRNEVAVAIYQLLRGLNRVQ